MHTGPPRNASRLMDIRPLLTSTDLDSIRMAWEAHVSSGEGERPSRRQLKQGRTTRTTILYSLECFGIPIKEKS